jgi:hypothetical protein
MHSVGATRRHWGWNMPRPRRNAPSIVAQPADNRADAAQPDRSEPAFVSGPMDEDALGEEEELPLVVETIVGPGRSLASHN